MVGTSPSLGDKFAGLREIAQAGPENRAFFPAAIHALIMACFAGIFARLEQLLALWQAGNLPVPASRHATPQAVRHHAGQTVRAPAMPAARLPRSSTRAAQAAPQRAARPAARHITQAVIPPLPATPPAARPRTRDPPARPAPTPSPNPAVRRRAAAPILFRYRNNKSRHVAQGVTASQWLR